MGFDCRGRSTNAACSRRSLPGNPYRHLQPMTNCASGRGRPAVAVQAASRLAAACPIADARAAAIRLALATEWERGTAFLFAPVLLAAGAFAYFAADREPSLGSIAGFGRGRSRTDVRVAVAACSAPGLRRTPVRRLGTLVCQDRDHAGRHQGARRRDFDPAHRPRRGHRASGRRPHPHDDRRDRHRAPEAQIRATACAGLRAFDSRRIAGRRRRQRRCPPCAAVGTDTAGRL